METTLELTSNNELMVRAAELATDNPPLDVLRQIQSIVKDLVITDEKVAEDATSLVKFIKRDAKKREDERKTAIEPHLEKQRAINAEYKKYSVVTDDIESRIKNSIRTFNRIQEEKRRAEEQARRKAEEERILAEAESQSPAVADAMLEMHTQNDRPEETKSAPILGSSGGSASSRKVTKWKVTDFAKLPDAYKLTDEKKLNAIARDRDGTRSIPGVEFYEEDSIVIR